MFPFTPHTTLRPYHIRAVPFFYKIITEPFIELSKSDNKLGLKLTIALISED
jgi:hypothetical protein